jgi:outer membrane protein OmpA-like peptidoglycan-associated protein
VAPATTAPAGTDIVDRMEPAEGAPPGWPNVAAALVKALVRLQSGSAELKDAALTVTGIAADDAQAQAVRIGLRAAVTHAYKLSEQIRVREPKVEPKATPEPPSPAPADAHPPAPSGEAKPKAQAPAAAAVPEPTSKGALAAPPAVEPAPKRAVAPPPPALPAAEPAPQPAAASPPPAPPGLVAECRANLGAIASKGRVLFDRDSAELDASSFDTLKRLAAATKRCPGVRIAIEGHADIEGTTEYNQRLSVKRAEAVVAYLVKAGADAQQLEAVGFGSSRPVARNDTLGNRARNRRIEIVVQP